MKDLKSFIKEGYAATNNELQVSNAGKSISEVVNESIINESTGISDIEINDFLNRYCEYFKCDRARLSFTRFNKDSWKIWLADGTGSTGQKFLQFFINGNGEIMRAKLAMTGSKAESLKSRPTIFDKDVCDTVFDRSGKLIYDK